MNTEYANTLANIETMLESALPKSENRGEDWLKESFNKEYPAVKIAHTAPLADPCKRLVDAGGKRWRPLLLVLCAKMELLTREQNPAEIEQKLATAYTLTPLLEFVHTASLIHDDIEDGADTRRGLPAAHLVYGLDSAINAGSWLYFEAAVCINRIADDRLKLVLYQLYTQELRRLHLGQAMDIAWHRDSSAIPTTDEYLAMVKNKTGTLSSLAAQIGVLAGGGSTENAQKMGSIAADIGAGFQVEDDVINLTTGNVGKKRGDDIVEGKKSLPALLYLENASSAEKQQLFRLFDTAKKDGIDSPAVEEAISVLSKAGVIEKASQFAHDLIQSACKNLHSLYAENAAAQLIEELFTSMLPSK